MKQFLHFHSYPIKFFRFESLDHECEESFPEGTYYLSGFSAKLLHSILQHSHFHQIAQIDECNLVIGSKENENSQEKLLPFQRMTHFQYTLRLGTKLGLHDLLTTFSIRNKISLNFYPISFLLPEQETSFQAAFDKESPFIIKPIRGSCGRGISIISQIPSSYVSPHVIAQKYITNPMLIHGNKFDLRFYVAVTSVDPLKVYVYNNGLVRLATEPYEIHKTNFSNLRAHLTNFSINKQSIEFQATNDISSDGQGSKWSHRPLWPFLASNGFDCQKIKNEVDDLISIVLISACPELRKQKNNRCSFELYAFDILLDENGGVHLLEVNISPALGTSSKLDMFIKAPLVRDWLNIALIPIVDCDNIKTALSVEKAFNGLNRNLAQFLALCEFSIADERCGDFRRVFPSQNRIHMYNWMEMSDLDQALLNWLKMDDQSKEKYVNENADEYLQFCDDRLTCNCYVF